MTREKTTPAEPEVGSEAGFVSRWSRLKHQAAKQAETAVGVNAAGHHAAAEKTEHEVRQASSSRILTDEDMPDIESLTPESDYTDFLSPGVSDKLRKLALRKLFHDEVFNIRDGLDEYDDDFTRFEKLGDIVTSDMRHQLELEAQRKAEQLLQYQDQSSDAETIQDVETNRGIDEPADENINITAGDSVQHDEIKQSAGGEKDHDAGDSAIAGESHNRK
jgi:hypothetical protein